MLTQSINLEIHTGFETENINHVLFMVRLFDDFCMHIYVVETRPFVVVPANFYVLKVFVQVEQICRYYPEQKLQHRHIDG